MPLRDRGWLHDDPGLRAVPGHNLRVQLAPADLLDRTAAGGIRLKSCHRHAQLCQPCSHCVDLGKVIDIEPQGAVGVLDDGHPTEAYLGVRVGQLRWLAMRRPSAR